MKKRSLRILSLCLVAAMTVSAFAGCGKKTETSAAEYTYHAYASALSDLWNPHTWEDSADSSVVALLETPLMDMSILDSESGEYQWVYAAAESIEDVTADHQDDLTKYGCTLVNDASETTEGYVYEIKLREGMKWEDGTVIDADTYVYSMDQLLCPEMQNYRANTFYAGDFMIAGADLYYFSGSTTTLDNYTTGAISAVADLTLTDGAYYTADGGAVYLAIGAAAEYLGGYSLADYVDAYGADYFDLTNWDALVALEDENGLVVATEESVGYLTSVISTEGWAEDETSVPNYMMYDATYDETTFDSVGFYKVDDYTIRWVCQYAVDINNFYTCLTSGFLVYEDLYESCKKDEGTGLITSTYGTSLDTTMSYGAYKMESLQEGKQMVFVQNENWYGYEVQDDGSLISYTDFLVDGENVQQYQTTRYVIDVMDDDSAKEAFLKGELTDWSPSADDLPTYSLSEQMYKAPETYTMRLFFNTNLEKLQEMDANGNTNSVVMSNVNFRKAFSLAIDRSDWVGATEGYIPAYYLLNSLYYYNVYEDPSSIYRNTDAAKQAVLDLYDVTYGGSNDAYATLDEAYESISGYNLTEAKELMKQACEELVADGLYTEGEDIYIQIAYCAGAVTSTVTQQTSLFQQYINEAAEGSGFGTITFEAVGNLTDRYSDVANGKYAIGYGAWGGAAFYPFSMMQLYCDPDYTSVHEIGCWDPTTETLTLDVNGTEYTMTWQEWSQSLEGVGAFASESDETKVQILADLESNYLEFYYCIPLASMSTPEMLSYQCNYYTDNYNIMYGFGGIRLTTYNYTDAEWEEYVESVGGTLSYVD